MVKRRRSVFDDSVQTDAPLPTIPATICAARSPRRTPWGRMKTTSTNSARSGVGEKLLSRNGTTLPLEPTQFRVLTVLVRGADHLVTRADLTHSVWKETYVDEGSLTVTISMRDGNWATRRRSPDTSRRSENPAIDSSRQSRGSRVPPTAMTSADSDNADIYVLKIGELHATRLTSDPALDKSPAWSPDGRRIAIIRTNGARGEILLISPAGISEQKVVETEGAPQSRGAPIRRRSPSSIAHPARTRSASSLVPGWRRETASDVPGRSKTIWRFITGDLARRTDARIRLSPDVRRRRYLPATARHDEGPSAHLRQASDTRARLDAERQGADLLVQSPATCFFGDRFLCRSRRFGAYVVTIGPEHP